ncbi:[NiFe]-hydrogenase assembly chaperone HybE [Sodalis sp. RH16]|uniref:[NiFe]-hydrogenase assembly chaperone HybE n=1 Tax=Sodalis sp. RH16 TaxID=3394331 RepID=UPI0039B3AFB8
MLEYIPGFEQNPQPLLERLFSRIAAGEMRTLPFYRPQIPVRACGFQRYEQQWIGALLTPWMLSLLVLPGPGQLWPRRPEGSRLALALPCGNITFTLGEIDVQPLGDIDGSSLGESDGNSLGESDGDSLGESDGDSLGESDGGGQYLSCSLMSPLPAALAAEPAVMLAQQCVRMVLALPVKNADVPTDARLRGLFTHVLGQRDA